MEIEFDPLKRALTLADRGIDFADAQTVFDGPVFEFEDTRFAYPEPYFATYGLLGERLVAVIWTETDTDRRVISTRKANDREYARYRHRLA
ncbi:BrnT family toxin [Sphingomonas ginsenosidivorax]|uniref:BrnT family toxin n=1 Tax=Sphingomonas ginsenosidivorax TaxID=862135 RepID=A0A5C6UJ90_9SPHN|nr:BrnT family toxin [Sphingomonas ginsenosidivorax]TXC72494.1 BrnT family toxin [Sphingomonas ginsenosidivorax]